MKEALQTAGYPIDVVVVNVVGAESSQSSLTAVCTFDLLQDVDTVNVWDLMGGHNDDIFVYRAGGVLAPSGYLPNGGSVSTNLSTTEGYENVYNTVVAAYTLGAGEGCGTAEGGLQIPGDTNQDGTLDTADAIDLLSYLFAGHGDTLACVRGADTNGSGRVDLADPIVILGYLFALGPPPDQGTECVPIGGCPAACGR